jgi:regulatory protein
MISPEEARKKLYRYCAYQERCHQEVEAKLAEWRIHPEEADAIIHHLITEGFLNEERFSRAFAGGKFRLKGWGRLRIVRELEQRGLSKNCIQAGLNEIDEHVYVNYLRRLLAKRAAHEHSENVYSLRNRIARFAIQRGFEPEMVWSELKRLIP